MHSNTWKNEQIKVAVSGPESCGKTTLANKLMEHYEIPLVSEYARAYFQNRDLNHEKETILHIAKEQIKLEKEGIRIGQSVICDSDLVSIKIWLSYYKHNTPNFIEEYLESQPYAFSVLLYPNVLWVNDGLRSNEFDRIALFERFVDEFHYYNIPYTIVKGIGEDRTYSAIRAINQHFTRA